MTTDKNEQRLSEQELKDLKEQLAKERDEQYRNALSKNKAFAEENAGRYVIYKGFTTDTREPIDVHGRVVGYTDSGSDSFLLIEPPAWARHFDCFINAVGHKAFYSVDVNTVNSIDQVDLVEVYSKFTKISSQIVGFVPDQTAFPIGSEWEIRVSLVPIRTRNLCYSWFSWDREVYLRRERVKIAPCPHDENVAYPHNKDIVYIKSSARFDDPIELSHWVHTSALYPLTDKK